MNGRCFYLKKFLYHKKSCGNNFKNIFFKLYLKTTVQKIYFPAKSSRYKKKLFFF